MAEKCKIPNCNNDVDSTKIKDIHQNFGISMCNECYKKAIVAGSVSDGVLSNGWDVLLPNNENNTEEYHNPLDCEDIPDNQTFGDIHGDECEPAQQNAETVEPEELTTEQKLKIAELKNDYGYDTETAIKMTTGKAADSKKFPECKHPSAIPSNYIPKLSIDDVKMYLCPNATDQEAYVFLELCKARKLNPFTNEVYLIKYNASDKAQTVVGKETFTRRAEAHSQFDGYEAGIIVQNEAGVIERRIGTFYLPETERVVGGWSKVYRKDVSRAFENEVTLDEYIQHKKDGTVNKMWSTKQATLIRKVALTQNLREAYPSEFGGLYERAELDIVGD